MRVTHRDVVLVVHDAQVAEFCQYVGVLKKRMSLLRRENLTDIVNGGIVIAVSTVLATASFT